MVLVWEKGAAGGHRGFYILAVFIAVFKHSSIGSGSFGQSFPCLLIDSCVDFSGNHGLLAAGGQHSALVKSVDISQLYIICRV